MMKIAQWGQDKPLPLAFEAMVLAAAGELAVPFLEQLAVPDLDRRIGPRPPLRQWLRLYRRHKHVFDLSLRRAIVFLGGSPVPDHTPNLMRLFKRIPEPIADRVLALRADEGLPADAPPAARALADTFHGLLHHGQNLIAAAFADRPLPAYVKLPPAFEPELQFLVRVWFPIVLFAKEHPARVLRAARQGDLPALELLLRIDKDLIFDPRIASIFREQSQNPRGTIYRRLCKALRSTLPAGKPAQLKADLLALLCNSFQGTGGITTDQLRRLADACASDKTGGRQPIDTQLPADVESFRKHLKRSRGRWRWPFGQVAAQRAQRPKRQPDKN